MTLLADAGHFLSDAGHFLWIDQPQAFAAEVASFLLA